MKHEVVCDFKYEMLFEAEVDGHKINMDASPEFGGKNRGPRPKPLVLAALSGCTGMDVVSILNKMHVNFNGFKIYVSGTLADDHPKYYKEIHVVYEFVGSDLLKSEIEKAVKLSQGKYCGVLEGLKPKARVTYEIKYIGV